MADRRPTDFVYLEGMFKYTRHITPEVDLDGKANWNVTFYPKPASLETIQKWVSEGLKNKIKKDDDGYFIKFRRDVIKEFKGGRKRAFEPPEVIDANNQPVDVMVGNGSTGILKLETYIHPTPYGGTARAARFAGIKLETLVPFDARTDYVPDSPEERLVRGMPDKPTQSW